MFRQKPIYLFHHVPKTAGSTLSAAMESLGSRGLRLTFKCKSKQDVNDKLTQLIQSGQVKPRHLLAIYGHRVFWGVHEISERTARYFTFLRSPFGRVKSHFRFHCTIAKNPQHPRHELMKARMFPNGKQIPIERWYDEHCASNLMVRFLAYANREPLTHAPREMNESDLEDALVFLTKCWFVGFTERSDHDIPFVCREIGVRVPQHAVNVSAHELAESDKAILEQLVAENEQLDLRLYKEAWRNRFGEPAARMP